MDEQARAVHMEEYKDLRHEIHQRVQAQLLVLGGNVALAGLLIPLARSLHGSDDSEYFFLLPLLFCIVAWIYFEQDICLLRAAKYIDGTLVPKINHTFDVPEDSPEFLLWERHNAHKILNWRGAGFVTVVMAVFRFAATIAPGIASLVIATIEEHNQSDSWWHEWSTWSQILFILDIATLALICGVGLFVLHGYQTITQHRPPVALT